ncbi:MAG: hypothetical protein U0136_11310 [Bdellovibrionota bacterium]
MKLRFAGLLLVLSILCAVAAEAEPVHSIRDVDFRHYLLTHNYVPLTGVCAAGSELARLEIQFGTLVPNHGEQAVVEAVSCLMGTGGADIVKVFSLGKNGEPEELEVNDSTRLVKRLYQGQSWTPRLEIRDGKLVRWFVMYEKGARRHKKAGFKREITYRWEGDKFVVADVKDFPPGRAP